MTEIQWKLYIRKINELDQLKLADLNLWIELCINVVIVIVVAVDSTSEC